MLLAEELEVDCSEVSVEAAPVGPGYWHTRWGEMQGTRGSTSVSSEWDRLRRAVAAAGMMLIQAAAETWNVDPKSCRAEKATVIHGTTRQKLSYGELGEKASRMKPPQYVPLKQPKEFKILG